jgi:hypothetical protein
MLEEGVSDHRHERMTVKALPRSSLEVVKTELFFQPVPKSIAPWMVAAKVRRSVFAGRLAR